MPAYIIFLRMRQEKALLFISVIGLTDVSGFSRRFVDQTGAGYRNKIAGIGFTVGSLSMVGVRLYLQDLSARFYLPVQR